MENTTLEKTLDTVGSIAKVAANLSEAKKEPKPRPISQSDDNSNRAQTGSQSVIVSVDKSPKKEPKPVEKHIHEFPENRPLTTEECELALKKAQMEYDLKKAEQDHVIECDKLNWKHQIEQEKKNEKMAKIRRIIGGILVAVGIGGLGYSIYTDYRDNKNKQVVPKALPEAGKSAVNGEGTVN